MLYANDLYGKQIYSAAADQTDTEDEYRNLMELLPDYYRDIREMKELQTILGHAVGKLEYATEDMLNQCFITSATWGLDRWEKLFGLPTNKGQSYKQRREILLAKLRGSGTTTKTMIQNVASAFAVGEVAVKEYPEEYRFVVQFIGIKGIPQNLALIMDAIEEIKPAHLAYSFQYTYTTWEQLKSLTWENKEQKTWADLRVYEGE